MKLNTYVYPHPVNYFIIETLGMTVEQFAELHNLKQSTIASWVTREKSVESLPASFIYSLSLSAGKDMSAVYNDLLDIQTKKWTSIQGKQRKKERLDV
ncbi:type III secretion system protein PrgN [Enterococcus sp. DIV0660C]|uniref:type III secretion system protein PrgN n=1 Tax=Enterococcus sp. DIV0660C TaxID=2230880 RepID=UPI001A8D727D|nr:type III secretion system protein PrgN [Enterococcus sp. DIV0660C]MBO0430849.1 type III secretion system protein PrgN [Enterococcus sp. DIV0660C]